MNMSKFVERLKELIFDTGKSANVISEEIGCGNATLSHYLTGRHIPTVEMAVKLAEYFHCSVEYLLGRTDKNEIKNFKPCPPFNEQLPIFCEKCKITRYKIRKETNISESVLRYWAQGKTKPSIFNLDLIAEKFDVTIDFILGRET